MAAHENRPRADFVELSRAGLSSFLRGSPCVIHFWASWNMQDASMCELLVSRLAPSFAGKLRFASFCVDPIENHAICQSEGLIQLPSLILYKNGEAVSTIVGQRNESELAAVFTALLGMT